jgi:hypothetical protein
MVRRKGNRFSDWVEVDEIMVSGPEERLSGRQTAEPNSLIHPCG